MSADPTMQIGYCVKCQQGCKLVGPLHGALGGPVMCIPCGIEWHAKFTRIRKAGRIVVRAMKAYLAAGGDFKALSRFKDAALGVAHYDVDDVAGANVPDITSELLEDTIRLTHPDRHPPERREAADRVTQELLTLKPFVFPAPKPAEVPARNASSKSAPSTAKEPLPKLPRMTYPCEVCADQVPYFYCAACTAEYEKRRRAKLETERAKRHAWQVSRRARLLEKRQPTKCQGCQSEFKGRRKDAVYCSAACRQAAHRQRVTDKSKRAANEFLPVTQRVAEAA